MFKTGSPVKGVDFIDRKKHIPIFKAYLENNQHVMIKAPRRFGKTSLIKQVFEHEKAFDFIYIDLRRAVNLTSLSEQIIQNAYSFAGIENFFDDVKKSITGLFRSIQKIKLDDLGEITLSHIENGVKDEREYFLHALDVVEKIAQKKELKIKLVFDEFQDMMRLGDAFLLEQMRSSIQHHECVTYVFLGSIESIMTKIFSSKSSPFFHFARVMSLDGLDIEELYEYASDVFNKIGVPYDDSFLKLIEFLEGHPDYSIQVLQMLYYRSISKEFSTIDRDACIDVLTSVILENHAYLEELISKAKQKKHHYEVLFDIANNSISAIESKTLYNINVSLEDMGLVRNIERGKYVISDIFLKILLQQKDDKQFLLERKLEIGF